MLYINRYGNSADNTIEENSSIFSLSKCAGYRQQGHVGTVKLCTNKILQFLTGGAR